MFNPLRVPLSVLDLAVVSDGASTASALADTTRLAQRAEALGYSRFWVAELMLFSFTHGLAERMRSLELLAQPWGLQAPRPATSEPAAAPHV